MERTFSHGCGVVYDRMVTWIVNGAHSRRIQQPALDWGEVDAAMSHLKDVPGMVTDG